jgi:hypothetical protein
MFIAYGAVHKNQLIPGGLASSLPNGQWDPSAVQPRTLDASRVRSACQDEDANAVRLADQFLLSRGGAYRNRCGLLLIHVLQEFFQAITRHEPIESSRLYPSGSSSISSLLRPSLAIYNTE